MPTPPLSSDAIPLKPRARVHHLRSHHQQTSLHWFTHESSNPRRPERKLRHPRHPRLRLTPTPASPRPHHHARLHSRALPPRRAPHPWQPAGQAPVLFLSPQSAFAPDKAIRGGVPIIFPWFGPRTATSENPPHRRPLPRLRPPRAVDSSPSSPWPATPFTSPSPSPLRRQSRALGFDHFRLAFQLILGRHPHHAPHRRQRSRRPRSTSKKLSTPTSPSADAEASPSPASTTPTYLDKTDHLQRKQQTGAITFTAETDRPYLNTEATVTLDDPTLHPPHRRRQIRAHKPPSSGTPGPSSPPNFPTCPTTAGATWPASKPPTPSTTPSPSPPTPPTPWKPASP